MDILEVFHEILLWVLSLPIWKMKTLWYNDGQHWSKAPAGDQTPYLCPDPLSNRFPGWLTYSGSRFMAN